MNHLPGLRTGYRTGVSSLLRVLAGYVAAILLVQALAAAMALGAGPSHRHRAQGPAQHLTAPSLAALAFSHRDLAHAQAHAEAHTSGERHHHAVGDRSVLRDGAAPEALDLAAQALGSALALLALNTGAGVAASADGRRHVLRAATGWARRSVTPEGPYRPPRQG